MRNCAHSILCCEEPTLNGVTEVLYAVKEEISLIGEGLLNNMLYGTRLVEDHDRIRKLNVFHSLLCRLRDALRNQGSLCLSCKQVHIICEGISRTLGLKCSGKNLLGLEIDSSRLSEWTPSNPFCISYDKWQAAMYRVCDTVGLTITRVDGNKACQLAADIVQKKVDCEIFAEIAQKHADCVVKYNIFTDDKSCEANYVGVITKNTCKINYKALIKSSKCDVGFHDYVNIMNCGVDAKLVKKIYSCGMSVKFNGEKRCPMIVTAEGKEYFFTDFDVHNETDIWQRLTELHIA